MANIGWGQGTWGNNKWGGQLDVSFSVTGFEATTSLGNDVGQIIEVSTNLTTALVQTPTILANCNFSVTGVQGAGQLGDEATIPQARVSVTQSAMTGSVGNSTPTGDAIFSVTGVSASADVSQLREDPISLIVTVYNDGGGNKYYIDGVKQATLTLYVGNTYRFDQSDSSNAGHPLRLSSVTDGTHGGYPEYTTGVTTNGTPGSSGAYTQIVIAEDTPTLYYYCSNHSGMGGQANIATTFTVETTTGAPVTTVVGTTALGSVTSTGGAGVTFTTLNELTISLDTLAISGGSVLSLTGISVSGLSGEENVWGLIRPSQEANWIERVA